MRDVATVSRGERLYVHHTSDVHAAGVFVECRDGLIIVDHTVGYSRTPLAGHSPYVTDVDGEVIGEPEPALPTIPPELE
ncbi:MULTISPECIES: hypothetical protein [unclassified Microbacterium]|uniref:hypothetical protein n=1 Tax=unclassified Microbacterium TaxID=2609290 RepID=UPI00386BD126